MKVIYHGFNRAFNRCRCFVYFVFGLGASCLFGLAVGGLTLLFVLPASSFAANSKKPVVLTGKALDQAASQCATKLPNSRCYHSVETETLRRLIANKASKK